MSRGAVVNRQVFSGRGAGAQPAPAVLVVQFLRFTVGSEAYVVRIEGVREILEMTPITPVPLMPACVRGVLTLRGLVVPVIDLSVRLGYAATQIAKRTAIIVVSQRGGDGQRLTLGLLVDTVQEVFKCRESDLEPAPKIGSPVAAAFVRAVVRVGEQVAVELALDELVGPDSLAGLVATAPLA
jgi:purine-binding chemotaxis protein CheW